MAEERGGDRCHVCPVWMAYTFDNPFRRLFHRPERMFREYVKPGATVLDFGCGLGFFSIAMARRVGDQGLVIAADLQQEMLDRLARRAKRAGVGDRIRVHRTDADGIGLSAEIDFGLACWVVHETPDIPGLFREFASLLKPGGHLYVMEPKTHVSEDGFEEMMSAARDAGLRDVASPKDALSKTVVFRRPIDRDYSTAATGETRSSRSRRGG